MKQYTTIENNELKMVFPFNTSRSKCEIKICFHRTLRIPDDNKKYSLPPSLGNFPLLHTEDYQDKLPSQWKEHGGIFMPMHQSEAMWISFHSEWPFAVKIASGKVNAISGESWSNELENDSKKPQDYIVVPSQPWIDGFNISKGVIRQFVAFPLNSGFTVEEQITGEATVGGLQIMVFPMLEDEYKKIERPAVLSRSLSVSSASKKCMASGASMSFLSDFAPDGEENTEMGFGAGGFMEQEIYKDKFGIDKWSKEYQRVFVHLLNSLEYKNITGKKPPNKPLSSSDYKYYNYPWFNYYSDESAISGSKILNKIDSIAEMEIKKDTKNKKLKDGNW